MALKRGGFVKGQPQEHHGLRPWADVARMYTEITGKPITERQCQYIHKIALKKLSRLLEKERPDGYGRFGTSNSKDPACEGGVQ